MLTNARNASGSLSIQFTVPNNSSICRKFYLQFFPLDSKVNAFGVSASNYGRILIGR